MKITFKNVGQGDSIIIEWEDNGKNKIGIIDCNRYGGTNPVLEYIIATGYRKISFLMLSHPHTDHFSGFTELLDYCIDNKIQVEYFLHSSNNMPAFWKAAVEGKIFEDAILKLFKTIRHAKAQISLKPVHVEGLMPHGDISLGEYKLRILAPTSTELDNYAKNYSEAPFDEDDGNKPSANWLSIFLKIHHADWYILLTSDCDKSVLKYYGIKRKEEFSGRLVLGQSPHHGAKKNHSNAFWRQINKGLTETPIVFSVGRNHYDHPNEDAIKFFRSNGFDIFSTNQIGYLATKLPTIISKETSLALDAFSSMVLSTSVRDKFNGDKSFEIDLSGNVKVAGAA